ncbi:MAG: hypothetical protein KatS3mg111_0754 [Pirellulaceae bacterium]|nr:MAG: hypothetical protein KatS3mg111_0754 [Pirellulaceae bacterium]
MDDYYENSPHGEERMVPAATESDRLDTSLGGVSIESGEGDDPQSSEISQDFVVRWEKLISTTNWEKGRIIHEWREALIASGAPATSYSDEAWARRVGGVTSQHVGRLRRVYERFGAVYSTYSGLYWSHFLAAMDWEDAEMWLEGAVQSGWSVSQMRRWRWETLGAVPEEEPTDEELITASVDEDFVPLEEMEEDISAADGTRAATEGPLPEGPDFGDERDIEALADDPPIDDVLPWEGDPEPGVSPLASLPSLPVDLADAVEQFKLAIIRHRTEGWNEVRPEDVVQALEALRDFVRQG